MTAFPFTLCSGFFYTQNLACTPKNVVLYMLLYTEGTKIRNKATCTPSLKMQWEPCMSTIFKYTFWLPLLAVLVNEKWKNKMLWIFHL